MYISIDIETTGLDPKTCQIIEIGAICGDKTYHCYVDNGLLRGESYALSMHAITLRRIAIKEPGFKYLRPIAVAENFNGWLAIIGASAPITVAGKNFAAFDKMFLDKLPNWHTVKIRHRIIDVGTLYWEPKIDDDVLPALKTCMERAGLEGDIPHTALEDAILIQKLIERKIK